MNSSFRNAPCKENYYGNVICNEPALGTFKTYQRGFLKVAAFKRTKPSIRKAIKGTLMQIRKSPYMS